MDLVAFDLVGPMAHFKKFYTNSSSLTYRIPPRTVLSGIIAALLGVDRDEYYEKLAMERAKLGVSLRTPVRTLRQTVNYLNTKNQGWDGSNKHTQIPVELLLPQSPAPFLRYTVYFAHENVEVTKEIYKRTSEMRYCYPLYLGLTECPAWIENPEFYCSENLRFIEDPEGPLEVVTAVPLRRLVGDLRLADGLRVYKDRMPFDFYHDRKIKWVDEVIWEANGRPMSLSVNGLVFHIPPNNTFGVFLEFG